MFKCSNQQFTSTTANIRYSNQLYDPPKYVEIDPPPYNEVSHTRYQPNTRSKIASSVNQPAPASIIPRFVEEVNSSPESVRHPWVTLRNRNRNRPMINPGYGQQNTQMAHSQNLGRREGYGGARPHVVDQVLHDVTHDMENIGIQGRESVQSDHVQRNPPTAGSILSLQRQTSLSRPTSLLGHGSRMGTISPIRTNSPVRSASRPTPFSRQQLEEHSRTYMSPVLENTRLPETIASGQTVDQTLLRSPSNMQTVEGSINLPQPVHTNTARRTHHSTTVQNRPTSRVEHQSISRHSSSRRSRLTSRGPYPSPARNLLCHIVLDMSNHRKGLDITLVEPAMSIHQTGIDEVIHLNLDEGHVNKAQIPDTDTNIHVDTGTGIVIPQAVVHGGVITIDMVTIVVLRVLVPRGVITIEVVVVTELTDAEIAEAVLVQVHVGATTLAALSLTIVVTGIEEEADTGLPLMILHQMMTDMSIIDVAVVHNPQN